ncbi:MAG: hypothetical protein P4L10_15630 [Acidobacteriaceae bacterium]|nr:hypothetical protein [Acidobacteriaceae bacterium]
MIRRAWVFLLAAALGLAAGCRSPRVDIRVENRTGAPIELLEVDYPSASFGVGRLAPGAVYPYGIQVRGSGSVRIQYTDSATHVLVQASGGHLQERQSGTLRIVLLPSGHVEFHPAS